ncbi:MAG TPA: TolC family protein, partial [Chitinophagales bacterium]|nr:TolC family protein [Chitinophagales bacterium]
MLRVGFYKWWIITGCMALLQNIAAQSTGNYVSLQQILKGVQANYELIKAQGSLVQAKQAAVKATNMQRLPQLNTMLEGDVASNNNVEGTYLTFGMIPTVTSGVRAQSKLDPTGGDAAFAGINWEAVNFGGYKARENLAKQDLLVQINTLARTEYDLNGIASIYYLELLRLTELEKIQQDNVDRLEKLKTSIVALVKTGVRPG